MREKAQGNECYAEMLAITLGAACWRHHNGRAFDGRRDGAAALVTRLVGVADPWHYASGGPRGVLDEEALADLGALGWEPVVPA